MNCLLGKPLRFATEGFEVHEIELLQPHNFFTAKETVYLLNMKQREYLRDNCPHKIKMQK